MTFRWLWSWIIRLGLCFWFSNSLIVSFVCTAVGSRLPTQLPVRSVAVVADGRQSDRRHSDQLHDRQIRSKADARHIPRDHLYCRNWNRLLQRLRHVRRPAMHHGNVDSRKRTRYIHACTHTYIHTYRYIHIYIHTCIPYIHTYIPYMHIIHAYIYAYIHTIHTYMHTHILYIHKYIQHSKLSISSGHPRLPRRIERSWRV